MASLTIYFCLFSVFLGLSIATDCQTLLQCYEELRTQDLQCREVSGNFSGRVQRCQPHLLDLHEKMLQQEYDHGSCVRQRLEGPAPVNPNKMPDKCQEAARAKRAVNAGPRPACIKEVDQKREQCRAMQQCCGESQYCHLQFELSTLHDDIRRMQLENVVARRDCPRAG